MTYGTLLKCYNEIQTLQQTSVLALFNRSKINDFIRENGRYIDRIVTEMKRIHQEFCFCNEDGEPFELQGKPALLAGKTFEDYQKRVSEFLNKEISVIL